MSSIKGIYAASMSIFKEDFSLDLEQTKKHAENLIDKGCHGVAILGSTGQAQLISVKEKMELIEHLSNSSQKSNFIIGTGNNSLSETINMMKHSKVISNQTEKFLKSRMLKLTLLVDNVVGQARKDDPMYQGASAAALRSKRVSLAILVTNYIFSMFSKHFLAYV